MVTLRASGVDRDSWRYTGLREVVPLVGAVGLTSGVLLLLRLMAPSVVGCGRVATTCWCLTA